VIDGGTFCLVDRSKASSGLSFTSIAARLSASSAHGAPPRANGKTMSKRETRRDDPAPEYDFSKGVRGRYVGRNGAAGRRVMLDDDVAREF
jgi:hypothetical protein